MLVTLSQGEEGAHEVVVVGEHTQPDKKVNDNSNQADDVQHDAEGIEKSKDKSQNSNKYNPCQCINGIEDQARNKKAWLVFLDTIDHEAREDCNENRQEEVDIFNDGVDVEKVGNVVSICVHSKNLKSFN